MEVLLSSPAMPTAMDLLVERKPDRGSLRLAAVLFIAGIVVYAIAQVFHAGEFTTPTQGPDSPAVFAAYANSSIWTLVHACQFAAFILINFGLLALFSALNVRTGLLGNVNRFAAASAVAALALNGVLYAVDGVALKQAVDSWHSAPSSEQSTYYAVALGIRGVEWGMRSYENYAMGLSYFLIGIVIASSARIPRPIGYIMGFTGLAEISDGWMIGVFQHAGIIAPLAIVGNFVVIPSVLIGIALITITAFRMKRVELDK